MDYNNAITFLETHTKDRHLTIEDIYELDGKFLITYFSNFDYKIVYINFENNELKIDSNPTSIAVEFRTQGIKIYPSSK